MVAALVFAMFTRPWMHMGPCLLGPWSVCTHDAPPEPLTLGGLQLMESKLLSSSFVPHKAANTWTHEHAEALIDVLAVSQPGTRCRWVTG